jgi:hypothetical protein
VGQYARALEMHAENKTILEELGDRTRVVAACSNLGLCYFRTGQYAQALALHSEAKAMSDELGDRLMLTWVHELGTAGDSPCMWHWSVRRWRWRGTWTSGGLIPARRLRSSAGSGVGSCGWGSMRGRSRCMRRVRRYRGTALVLGSCAATLATATSTSGSTRGRSSCMRRARR